MLLDTLLNIRWQDIIDVLLNSYILFRLYILLRGTRLFRTLAAIIMLLVVQRVAETMGLIITSWIMQGITALAAIIVIIVFRSEIRTVFQARGIKDIFWGLPGQNIETPVEIIAGALFEMARHRIGALVVLPARQSLEGLIHSGIPWNGTVSREMLLSVFWPDNPVHDGAAVIDGNAIREVAAILPLSERSDIPSYYGTRHRAALGISERADALAVVVSEERGEISVARSGDIEPVDSRARLEGLLRAHSGAARAAPRHPRQARLELALAGLVSFFIVTSIWVSFSRSDVEALTTVKVPIEYVNRGSDMEILSVSDSAATLQLGGSRPLIRSLEPSQIKVRFNLANATVGPNVLTLTQEQISLPPGVVLKNIEPDEIQVQLDLLEKKRLPVQADWVGKLPEGIRIVEVHINPGFVEVVGGKSLLQDMETVYTGKLPVDEIKQSGKVTAGLALNPASVKLAPGSSDRIEIDYVVASRGNQASP
jgi:diadenylate cyclase